MYVYHMYVYHMYAICVMYVYMWNMAVTGQLSGLGSFLPLCVLSIKLRSSV